MIEEEFTHLNKDGLARMVDVESKKVTSRMAKASGKIFMNSKTIEKIYANNMKKGNVLAVAQVAGIMGLKKCSELIPMAHSINILGSDISFTRHKEYIKCECIANCEGKTGIEMEVITGVSIALITIYDMCKAIDKEMIISNIMLEEKTGGKTNYKKGE